MRPKNQRPQLTEEAVGRQLAGAIGKQVREDVWGLLVADRYVQEVIDGRCDAFDELKERYLQLNKRFSGVATKTPIEKREIPPDNRLQTLAKIAAIEAARMPEVVSFREDVLNGQLMAMEEIPTWVRRHWDEDVDLTLWVGVTLPLKTSLTLLHQGVTFEELESIEHIVTDKTAKLPLHMETEYLGYPELVNGLPYRTSAFAARGTILWRLKLLAKHLTNTIAWWEEDQAVGFVLSGAVPLLQKAVGKITQHNNGPSRVQLDLDSRLSSQEVAAFYAKVRRRVFMGRDKLMSEKHLALPVFLAEHNNGTWRHTMEAWNTANRKWAYSDWRAFARDASAAWKRVTGRKWTKGGEG